MNLKNYVSLLKNRKATLDDYKKIEETLKTTNILDVFTLFKSLLDQGESIEDILSYVDPFIHAIDQHLRVKESLLPTTGILSFLDLENKALEKKLNLLQDYFKENASKTLDLNYLKEELKQLDAFSLHYTKTQNLLFPSLEKVNDNFEGLRILWSMQDACKNALKATRNALDVKPFDFKLFSFALGSYFFKAFGLIQKENRFLLQASLQYLSAETLDDLTQQMFEYPFIFIDRPQQPQIKEKSFLDLGGYIKTDTGELNFEQLELLLNALPLDITLIDEDNKVRYFNKATDRVFPRSSAVIGRDVRNCHPSSSVDVVNKIIEALRHNEKDQAEFWIQMKGHFIYIKYIALRNTKGEYKGCLEVTQMVEKIRALEGERRLLEWD